MHPNPNHYQSLISHSRRHITCTRVLGRGPRHCSGSRAKGVCQQVPMQTQIYFGNKALQNTSAKKVSKKISMPLPADLPTQSGSSPLCCYPLLCLLFCLSWFSPSSPKVAGDATSKPPQNNLYAFAAARQGTAKPMFANHQGTPKMKDPGNSTFLSRWV